MKVDAVYQQEIFLRKAGKKRLHFSDCLFSTGCGCGYFEKRLEIFFHVAEQFPFSLSAVTAIKSPVTIFRVPRDRFDLAAARLSSVDVTSPDAEAASAPADRPTAIDAAPVLRKPRRFWLPASCGVSFVFMAIAPSHAK
jgi:hypothetical protein